MQHRVLVVDDHPDAVESICALLRVLGHHATGLTRGAGAIAAIDAFQPTVVFLDIGLPDISGYEIARAVRARGGSAPRLVAITGWGSAADRTRALDAGFDEHIVKPVDATIVLGMLERASASLREER